MLEPNPNKRIDFEALYSIFGMRVIPKDAAQIQQELALDLKKLEVGYSFPDFKDKLYLFSYSAFMNLCVLERTISLSLKSL